jgi:hypothetical protein
MFNTKKLFFNNQQNALLWKNYISLDAILNSDAILILSHSHILNGASKIYFKKFKMANEIKKNQFKQHFRFFINFFYH